MGQNVVPTPVVAKGVLHLDQLTIKQTTSSYYVCIMGNLEIEESFCAKAAVIGR